MNEKDKPIQQEKPLDDNKKAALLRYLAVMFIVAFVFVLLSMIGELRSSEATISELNASSTSALQKAEQLQDDNRRLETDLAYLEGRIEELEKQLEELELELAISEETLQNKKDELSELSRQATEDRQLEENRRTAYELLLQAAEDPTVLPELDNYKQYLGENALKFYENLTKEGEE